MKTKILILSAFCLLYFSNRNIVKAFEYSKQNQGDSISILSTPDLYNLTTNWVKEYCNINPSVNFKVQKLIDGQNASTINTKEGLRLISTGVYSFSDNESIWKIMIGMDAIVPIINSNNPLLDEINLQGLSHEKLANIFADPRNQNWSNLIENSKKTPLKVFISNNESIKLGIANFLNAKQITVDGEKVESDDEIVTAIRNDPNAIGFCKIASIINPSNQSLIEGIKLAPIDRNNNGKIDNNENIYTDLNALLRGVWIGKYPRELCSSIYLISSTKPTNENEIAFIAWVLTSGQQYLNSNGFSDLAYTQRQANIEMLYNNEAIVKTSNNRSAFIIGMLILVAFTVLFLIANYLIQRIRSKKVEITSDPATASSFINEKSITILDGLYFDKSHTWAFMEKDGAVSIGIDDFLQHVTGPITRIRMKEPGEQIKKGDIFLTLIQEGKQLNIKAPISGTVKANNDKLINNSSLINSSPYNEGWIYLIEPINWFRDTQFLIMAQGYKEWIRMELLHLKDFLAVALRPSYAENTQVVLQDGGDIKNGILRELKPEIWEDFQTHFLDSSK